MDRDTRGVSSVVGTALLAALVIGGTALLATTAATVASEQRSKAAAETAETNLDTLATEIEAAAYRPTARLETSLPDNNLDGALGVSNQGHITVEVGSPATGYTTKLDADLNALALETDETLVAYQGGGIWRRARNEPESAEIIRSPAITARELDNASLTVPVFLVRGEPTLSGQIQITDTASSRLHDPLYVPANEEVRITITSKFASAWARYFRQTVPEAHSVVQYTAGSDTVTLRYGVGSSVDLYLHGSAHTVTIEDS